jgi:hypothetical protein
MKQNIQPLCVRYQVIFLKHIKSLMMSLLIFTTILAVNAQNDDISSEQQIEGFGFFDRIIGQWEGPVISNTPAGSFDVWHVDFRPVSQSQVSQYSNLDANTINYTSFFVVRQNDQLKIAMRTEGVFMNKGCVTYEVMDSVNEAAGYYRFSDFQAGTNRAYTEFVFKGNKLTMTTYTSVFNKQPTTTLHSRWDAVLADRKEALKTSQLLDFPQAVAVKDFTDVFRNMSESIYFTFENDPYPSSPQPYVGSVTIHVSIDEQLQLKTSDELFIVLSTESLFEGLKYKKEQLKYFSKYAYLNTDNKSFTLTNVHPGTYYLYAFVDINNDKKHKKGDYMSSDSNKIIQVIPESEITTEILIDLVIP